MNYKRLVLITVVLLGICTIILSLCTAENAHPSSASIRPDLEYLNQVAPPQDPQLLFLLMSQYASTNRPAQGAEFLSARLSEFESRLTNPQRALYLSAIALLRAQHAPAVPFLSRIAWVNETIAMLDKAKQLSGGQVFVVNWIAGIVHAHRNRSEAGSDTVSPSARLGD